MTENVWKAGNPSVYPLVLPHSLITLNGKPQRPNADETSNDLDPLGVKVG